MIFSNPYKSKTVRKSRSVAINGYRSKYENSIANNIPSEFKDNVGYEVDKIEYILEKVYNPDFTIKTKGGKTIYIEAKGYLDASDRRKMIAVKKQNPDLDIRFIFQKASNKLPGKSKKTYGEWCDANGFMWCEGNEIPYSWYQ